MTWTVESIHIWFVVQSVAVPVILYVLYPRLLQLVAGRSVATASRVWLIAAGMAYATSWYMPSPLIDGENTALLTHLVGGGVFSALLWRYTELALAIRHGAVMGVVLLYFFVSGLGVANELLELALWQTIMPSFDPSDTWWDLLANTLGAVITYGCIRLILKKS